MNMVKFFNAHPNLGNVIVQLPDALRNLALELDGTTDDLDVVISMVWKILGSYMGHGAVGCQTNMSGNWIDVGIDDVHKHTHQFRFIWYKAVP